MLYCGGGPSTGSGATMRGTRKGLEGLGGLRNGAGNTARNELCFIAEWSRCFQAGKGCAQKRNKHKINERMREKWRYFFKGRITDISKNYHNFAQNYQISHSK